MPERNPAERIADRRVLARGRAAILDLLALDQVLASETARPDGDAAALAGLQGELEETVGEVRKALGELTRILRSFSAAQLQDAVAKATAASEVFARAYASLAAALEEPFRRYPDALRQLLLDAVAELTNELAADRHRERLRGLSPFAKCGLTVALFGFTVADLALAAGAFTTALLVRAGLDVADVVATWKEGCGNLAGRLWRRLRRT